jgi:hypothetical protein
MRFLCIDQSAQPEGPPTIDEITRMGALIEEMTKAGVLLATEGCQPSARGARVRLASGKVTVTDGPFTESKEIIGGFAIIQAKSKAEAVEWTTKFLHVAGDGQSEIRPLYDETDFPS